MEGSVLECNKSQTIGEMQATIPAKGCRAPPGARKTQMHIHCHLERIVVKNNLLGTCVWRSLELVHWGGKTSLPVRDTISEAGFPSWVKKRALAELQPSPLPTSGLRMQCKQGPHSPTIMPTASQRMVPSGCEPKQACFSQAFSHSTETSN